MIAPAMNNTTAAMYLIAKGLTMLRILADDLIYQVSIVQTSGNRFNIGVVYCGRRSIRRTRKLGTYMTACKRATRSDDGRRRHSLLAAPSREVTEIGVREHMLHLNISTLILDKGG